jgi:hypothetical protein
MTTRPKMLEIHKPRLEERGRWGGMGREGGVGGKLEGETYDPDGRGGMGGKLFSRGVGAFLIRLRLSVEARRVGDSAFLLLSGIGMSLMLFLLSGKMISSNFFAMCKLYPVIIYF